MPAPKRIAFVVQRSGPEVNGGSELLCRQVAEKMAERCPTELLTTCAVDYTTWADYYPAGEERIGKLTLRRFKVAKTRDVDSFNALSASISTRIGKLKPAQEEEWMRLQGPWSPDLFAYLKRHKNDYDAFIFFTYLYATTALGLPLVADKALLVPTAHDEWPIYLGLFDRIVGLSKGFVFLTQEEQAFMRRRFPKARLNGPVVGAAVEPPDKLLPEAFREKHGINSRYVLYVGRLDAAKGVDKLLKDFQAYRQDSGDDRTELVLVGKPVTPLPAAACVRPVGFVTEQEKWDAIAGCEALLMPSATESLSLACLEAWALGKPVLVNGHSDVLVGQCRRSQGGLWYSNSDEFGVALESLLGDAALQAGLGRLGKKFVAEHYRWPKILDAYCELIAGLAAA